MSDDDIKILPFIIYFVVLAWLICNLLPMIFIIKYRNLVNLYFLLGAVFGHVIGFMVAYLSVSAIKQDMDLEKLQFIWITPLSLIPSWITILTLSIIAARQSAKQKVSNLAFIIGLSCLEPRLNSNKNKSIAKKIL